MPARLQDKAGGTLRRKCSVCGAMDCLSRETTLWLPSLACTCWCAHVRLLCFVIAIPKLRGGNCQSAILGSFLPAVRSRLREELGRRQFFRPGDFDRFHRPKGWRFRGHVAFAFDLS